MTDTQSVPQRGDPPDDRTLTPVLTANWDQPDSFTLAGYKRTGGYKALPRRWPWRRTT